MIRIVESYQAGSTEHPPFEFKPYVSPKDRKTILGQLVPYGVIHGKQCTWISIPFGVPVAEAFQRTIALAEQYGMDTVWVNDPAGLFPPVARPARSKQE